MAPRIVPWIRTGLGTTVSAAADAGATSDIRATTTVEVIPTANDGADQGRSTARTIELYGPGDVVALDAGQIRNRFPTPGAPDAAWNHFAYIDLAAGDLPWRYSPAGPGEDGIAPPWLALVVVEDGVEATLETSGDRATLRVASAASLPPPTELWAWAHAVGEGDPSGFHARVMCPRRLRPGTTWQACLVPAFRTGRNAGLGRPAGTDPGPAWGPSEQDVDLPVYAHWTFHTGDGGTFRSLARRLQARELGPEIGARPLRIDATGAPFPSVEAARTDFVGAMASPEFEPTRKFDDVLDDFAEVYRAELGADDARDGDDPDPVVRLPRYGSPQRRGARLSGDPGHWYDELNTSPRHRAVAALGAEVVRNDQEQLVAAAWEHAAGLQRLNESLQRARLAAETARQRTEKFRRLPTAQQVQLSGPASDSITAGAASLNDRLRDAAISPTVIGGAFRRMARSGGPFDRAIAAQPASTATAPADQFVASTIDDGAAAFTPSEPAPLPAGLDIGRRPQLDPAPFTAGGTIDLTGHEFESSDGSLLDIGVVDVAWTLPTSSISIGRQPLLDDDLELGIPDPTIVTSIGPAVATTAIKRATVRKKSTTKKTAVKKAAVKKSAAKKTAVKKAAATTTVSTTTGLKQATMRPGAGPLIDLGSFVPSTPTTGPAGSGFPYVLSGDAGTYIEQLRDQIVALPFHVVSERPGDQVRPAAPAATLPSFDADVAGLMSEAIDPELGVRQWLDQHVVRRTDTGTEPAIAATGPIPTALTARPHFDVPMYERLRALSAEYVLPGIGLVPANTVGGLSVNAAFVESFLVGANHELSREFRWREYPAPLHLTWFDQFWDVGPDGSPDVPPIGRWRDQRLGTIAGGGERLVILVKGELIERFPDLAVYMVSAAIDGDERVAGSDQPTLPVFSGTLQPGVHFYGFDLPDLGAGDAGRSQVERAQFGGPAGEGWFFVLEERPTAPQFGLNEGLPRETGEPPPSEPRLLSWRHLQRDADDDPQFVELARSPEALLGHAFPAGEWFHDAAVMAAVTARRPTRVLMHATALLEAD